MVVEEAERELGTEETPTTIDPLYNSVQSYIPLSIPSALMHVDYRHWMRIRTKWALSDMEAFVCIRNNNCIRDMDAPLSKTNRRTLRTELKHLIHSDPLWQYMPDIDARIRNINKKLYQFP